ncbi:MAG: hypothetical protein V1792_11210, partial [Pseudomonadota bacterium]
MAGTKHPWYDIAEDGTILQGDILSSCSVYLPSIPDDADVMILLDGQDLEVPLQIINTDLIIMSQSCDIENDKTPLVMVCPVLALTSFVEMARSEWQKENPEDQPTAKKLHGWVKNQIKQTHKGQIISQYLIPSITHRKIRAGFRFVDFGRTFSVMYPDLERMALSQKRWLRIKPPYREHLSQAFGRFFMRVAL